MEPVRSPVLAYSKFRSFGPIGSSQSEVWTGAHPYFHVLCLKMMHESTLHSHIICNVRSSVREMDKLSNHPLRICLFAIGTSSMFGAHDQLLLGVSIDLKLIINISTRRLRMYFLLLIKIPCLDLRISIQRKYLRFLRYLSQTL